MTSPQGQEHSASLPVTPCNSLFAGLQPAFHNRVTGESHLPLSEDGTPAKHYGFYGLPTDWIAERDSHGEPIALKSEIIAGYWLNARFVQMSDIARMPHNS